jgi:hypothetical protein
MKFDVEVKIVEKYYISDIKADSPDHARRIVEDMHEEGKITIAKYHDDSDVEMIVT